MQKTYFITLVSGVMTNDKSKTAKIKKGDNTFAAKRCNVDCCETIITILAERTNGRAYATMLRLSVVVCL